MKDEFGLEEDWTILFWYEQVAIVQENTWLLAVHYHCPSTRDARFDSQWSDNNWTPGSGGSPIWECRRCGVFFKNHLLIPVPRVNQLDMQIEPEKAHEFIEQWTGIKTEVSIKWPDT